MHTTLIGFLLLLVLPTRASALTLVRTLESPSDHPAAFGYAIAPLAE